MGMDCWIVRSGHINIGIWIVRSGQISIEAWIVGSGNIGRQSVRLSGLESVRSSYLTGREGALDLGILNRVLSDLAILLQGDIWIVRF